MQVIQPAHQPLEIADAVAVGVHVGADGKAIDDRVLVPEIVDHAQAALIGPPPCLSGPMISGEGLQVPFRRRPGQAKRERDVQLHIGEPITTGVYCAEAGASAWRNNTGQWYVLAFAGATR